MSPRYEGKRTLPLREPAGHRHGVASFDQARVLTFDTDRDVSSVLISHEALLRAWPWLRQWIDTDRRAT